MEVLVRTAGDPERLVPAIARAVREVDPDLPLEGAHLGFRVYAVSASLRESLAYRRFITGLLAAFALPALLLAALGIYGVVAYLVTQRGPRSGSAWRWARSGATCSRLVLGEGMRLAAIGVLIGAAGAALTTRWLRAQLYEVSATDPVSFVLAALVLAAIAVLATLVPARRATAIDPARALQAE